MKEKIFCKACNTQTEYVIDNFSRYHLKRFHPEIENLKHYYDLFLKKEGEGKCLICGKEVPVHSFRISTGYQKFCSNKCGLQYVNSNWNVNAETRRKNNLEKYGVKHPMQLKENNDKRIHTNIEKYGFENPSQNEYCKEKTKETCLEKYGVDNPIKFSEFKEKQKKTINDFYNSEEGQISKEQRSINRKEFFKTEDGIVNRKQRSKKLKKLYISEEGKIVKKQMSETRIQLFKTEKGKELLNRTRKTWEKNGKWIPLSKKSQFDLYKRDVINITYRLWKKKLFKNWNGLDTYTGEKLITTEEYRKINNIPINDNKLVNKNPLQPTIDHKTSIYHGFLNNIPAEEIAHIDNLCICSRSNNTKKSCRVRFL